MSLWRYRLLRASWCPSRLCGGIFGIHIQSCIAASTTFTANEAVSISFPEDGEYTILVHGYNVPGDSAPFDLTIDAIQGSDVSVSGLPAQIPAGGSGNVTIFGTINVTRSDTAGANSNFVLTNILPASLPLGPFVYSLGAITYTAPTIGGGGNANGGISILINEIPEPTSVVLMGLGVVGLGGLGVYRRRRDA